MSLRRKEALTRAALPSFYQRSIYILPHRQAPTASLSACVSCVLKEERGTDKGRAAQFLPAFYAPYFLHISRGEGGERNLAFACVFACLLACLLVALHHLKAILENPFRQQSKWIGFTGRGQGGQGQGGVGGGAGNEWGKTDNVNVEEEMRLCREALEIAEQDLENAWFRELEIHAPPEADDVEVSAPPTS